MHSYDQIKKIKDQYTEVLMTKAHVVGVGIGFAHAFDVHAGAYSKAGWGCQ